MKVEKIVFTFTGRIGEPQPGDYFPSVAGTAMLNCPQFGHPQCKHKIYTREVIEEEWMPTENQWYYTPRISMAGIASSEQWINNIVNGIAETSLIFPTPELATAKAQEWLDAEKAK